MQAAIPHQNPYTWWRMLFTCQRTGEPNPDACQEKVNIKLKIPYGTEYLKKFL
jgi:hypothetical protein